MKVKLRFRVGLLTAILLLLVSTFKTQPCAACSPAWYEGCLSYCDSALITCMGNTGGNAFFASICVYKNITCKRNCGDKLARCYGGDSGGGGFEEQPELEP